MKKRFLLILAIMTAFLSLSVFSAEIYEAKCTKSGVMQYEGGGKVKGAVDELFQFQFYVSADTKEVLLQSESGEPFVVAKANKKYKESYSMASIEYTSPKAGKRTFKFFAKGYDGSITPYDTPVYLDCYERESGGADMISASCDKEFYQVYEKTDYNQTRINIVLETSINTSHIRMTANNGAVIDNIKDYCTQRGSCDIVDGKKIWKFYMQSSLVGERVWTFYALDRNKQVQGDSAEISFMVYKPEDYEVEIGLPKGPAGKDPGAGGEGETGGDDMDATGTEDGVDGGGDGKSDTDTNFGSDEKGEVSSKVETEKENDKGIDGGTSTTAKPKDEPKEEPKEEPREEPEDDSGEESEDKKDTPVKKPETSENVYITRPSSEVNYDKNSWTYEFTGFGNCCKDTDFLSFSVPSSTKTLVIEYPDGSKINVVDQEEKGLAIRTESRDGKYTFWDVWVGNFEYNDLKITLYDKDYKVDNWYTTSKTGPFYEEQQRMFDEAVLKEYLIETNPKQRIITLTINDEFMTIDGERVEVDPGRGTKPLIVDGRTLLPVRAIVEALGGEIFWTAGERKVTCKIFNRVIEFWIDKNEMKWNNIPREIDVPAKIINDRTMLPIRFLAECLDHTDVTWNQGTKTVTIIYNYN